MTNFARVHIGSRLRRRPAGRTFTRIMGLAARQHIARVVEMHDLLQASEISIMPVGLHEGRIGPLVHVAKCRHLNSRLVVRRQLEPSRIDCRRLAEQMSVAEKSTDTPIDEGRTHRISDIPQRVGPIFAIVGKSRVGGNADITGSEVCE
jgi:hypothetical protein